MSGHSAAPRKVTGEGEETPNALRYFWRLPSNNRGGLVCKLVLCSFIQENKYIQVNSIASHTSQRHCIHTRTWLSSRCSNRAQLCSGFRSPTPLPCSSPEESRDATRRAWPHASLVLRGGPTSTSHEPLRNEQEQEPVVSSSSLTSRSLHPSSFQQLSQLTRPLHISLCPPVKHNQHNPKLSPHGGWKTRGSLSDKPGQTPGSPCCLLNFS